MSDTEEVYPNARPRGLGIRKASKTTRSDPRILARRRLTAGVLAEEHDSTAIPIIDKGSGSNFTGESTVTGSTVSTAASTSTTTAGLSGVGGSSSSTALNQVTVSRRPSNEKSKLVPQSLLDSNGNPNRLSNSVSGVTGPGVINGIAMKDITYRNHIKKCFEEYKLSFMCRAFSCENKDGHHDNEDRYFCEEHLVRANKSKEKVSISNTKTPNSDINKQKAAETLIAKDNNTVDKGPSGPVRPEVDLFVTGVMDGHDGALAADIVSDKLPTLVINKCLKGACLPHEAHAYACQVVEELMKKQDSSAGCCVNSCLCWGRYLWCSNLGDCRTVFVLLNHWGGGREVKTGKFVWLSRDQRANKPYEVVRMRSKGYDNPIIHGRIEGCLEPSRTIGDLDLKENLPNDIISITPETRGIDIIQTAMKEHNLVVRKEDKDQTNAQECRTDNDGPIQGYGINQGVVQGLLIQGTDGLWDGLSGDEILNILQEYSKELRELQEYCDRTGRDHSFDPENPKMIEKLETVLEALTLASVNKPECSDDTTCVISLITLHEREKLVTGKVDRSSVRSSSKVSVTGGRRGSQC